MNTAKARDTIEVLRVSDLQKSIQDRDGDELVHCQIAAENGQVWSVRCNAGPVFGSKRGLVLSFFHKDLVTLPEIDYSQSLPLTVSELRTLPGKTNPQVVKIRAILDEPMPANFNGRWKEWVASRVVQQHQISSISKELGVVSNLWSYIPKDVLDRSLRYGPEEPLVTAIRILVNERRPPPSYKPAALEKTLWQKFVEVVTLKPFFKGLQDRGPHE